MSEQAPKPQKTYSDIEAQIKGIGIKLSRRAQKLGGALEQTNTPNNQIFAGNDEAIHLEDRGSSYSNTMLNENEGPIGGRTALRKEKFDKNNDGSFSKQELVVSHPAIGAHLLDREGQWSELNAAQTIKASATPLAQVRGELARRETDSQAKISNQTHELNR